MTFPVHLWESILTKVHISDLYNTHISDSSASYNNMKCTQWFYLYSVSPRVWEVWHWRKAWGEGGSEFNVASTLQNVFPSLMLECSV